MKQRKSKKTKTILREDKSSEYQHIVVVVLGDVGRSPRMQYHALSLSKLSSTKVTLLGYSGEQCIQDIQRSSKINIFTFSPFSLSLPRSLFLLYAPFKVIFQILQLFWILFFSISKPDAFLVQNPPSIPTLFVVWVVSRLRGTKFIIDWHNLGFTVLGISLGNSHILVKIAKWTEQFFGKKADYNFCVTKAMKKWLKKEWSIDCTVLYDNPPPFFKPTSLIDQHKLFLKLQNEFKSCYPGTTTATSINMKETWRTKQDNKNSNPILKENRSAFIVSSTSWTKDEDFGILLDALIVYENKIKEKNLQLPQLVVVVTGKGPEKEVYLNRIKKLKLQNVQILTMWLEAEDYPLLLGSADLGVCLHTSTSGLDLPMKVLDMFGCGLPVCAVDFNCLNELVKSNINGKIFQNSHELSKQLVNLLTNFPNNSELSKLKKGVQNIGRWEDSWKKNAAPVFQNIQHI